MRFEFHSAGAASGQWTISLIVGLAFIGLAWAGLAAPLWKGSSRGERRLLLSFFMAAAALWCSYAYADGKDRFESAAIENGTIWLGYGSGPDKLLKASAVSEVLWGTPKRGNLCHLTLATANSENIRSVEFEMGLDGCKALRKEFLEAIEQAKAGRLP